MKIILSPTKKMIIDDYSSYTQLPEYIDKTSQIKDYLCTLTKEELKQLWKCNDKILQENRERLDHMDLYHHLSPALYSYEGLAFKYLSPSTLDLESLEYLEHHLRILSGFYGILRPSDGITPYRLEMQAKTSINNQNLYDFWDDCLYQSLDDEVIINLASKEYSQCIEKHLKESDHMITLYFVENINGQYKQKGTLAKMARGSMVRYMATHQIKDLEEIKKFNEGYYYDDHLSDENHYYFVKEKDNG